MAARGRRRGGAIASVVWFVVIASLILAFYKVPTNRETSSFGDVLVAKSESVKAWVTGGVSEIDTSKIPVKLH